jgi:hypothetical protein
LSFRIRLNDKFVNKTRRGLDKLKDTKGLSLSVEVTGVIEPEKQVYNQADFATL